jgi:hemerythrin-like metal-binding protein
VDALIWSERFVTGLGVVDEQHRRLVELINTFGELCANHAVVPRVRLEMVVGDLARYAWRHFTDEEALMDAAGVDPRFVTAHKASHARFFKGVDGMRDSNFLDAPETSRALLRFLLNWLAFHILGSDMQLARQIERVKRGETREEAFAAEVHDDDGPAQLLLAALDDLLNVIARRNAELRQANRTLEARVAERTAALQASNEQLAATVATLRATQVRLVESEKLASVGQLASGLAHEINNPLAFISANLTALQEHGADLLQAIDAGQALEPRLPEQLRDELHHAYQEADVAFVREDLGHLLKETRSGVQRVQAIVRDLKDFSHVDDGALIELDLRSCVETTLKVLPTKHREGVRFVTAFSDAPPVRCQAASVNQTLLSLLLNAGQAVRDLGAQPGVVTVRTGAEGDGVFLEVEDAGVGISAEVLPHVFEPFFTTRPPGQGTGLGLSAAYNCARAHGGRLEVTSKPGAGSTFRLWLPLEAPASREAVPSSLSNPFNARRTQTGS